MSAVAKFSSFLARRSLSSSLSVDHDIKSCILSKKNGKKLKLRLPAMVGFVFSSILSLLIFCGTNNYLLNLHIPDYPFVAAFILRLSFYFTYFTIINHVNIRCFQLPALGTSS